MRIFTLIVTLALASGCVLPSFSPPPIEPGPLLSYEITLTDMLGDGDSTRYVQSYGVPNTFMYCGQMVIQIRLHDGQTHWIRYAHTTTVKQIIQRDRPKSGPYHVPSFPPESLIEQP